MKSLLLLHCFLFFIGYSLAANDGGCQIDGIDDNDFMTAFTIYVNDTEIDANVLETPFTGTLEVQSYQDNSNFSYFEVAAEDSNFVIKTKPDFSNVDTNTPKQTSTSFLVTVDCTLRCAEGTSSLIIRIFVNDVNTHAPAFNAEKYEFKVPSPIMPRTDFSIYGDLAIIATDLDFSNQNIEFTVDPDDFSISTLTAASSKDYTAVFSARSVILLTGTREYTITATDSGSLPGTLSSTTTITLTLDESNSLDIPTFKSSSYSFNYTVESNTPKLIELDGPISITTNRGSTLTADDVELTGEYNDYFDAVFDSTTSTFQLTPNKLLPSDIDSFLILTLAATTDNTAVTSLIVYQGDDETPHFSSIYYTGSYDDISNTVELDSAIEVTSASTPNVTLSGDEEYAKYFQINLESDTYIVAVLEPLPSTILGTEVSLPLTLVASVDDSTAYATLVINLPAAVTEHSISFSKPLYDGTYSVVDQTVSFQVDGSIEVETTAADSDVETAITSDTGYEEYFGFSYSKNVLTIVKAKNLPESVLKSTSFIPLILTVGLKGTTDAASAVLNVAIDFSEEDDDTTPISFSTVLYTGKYVVSNGIGEFTVDSPITVITDEVDSKVKVSVSNEYNTYFSASYSNKIVTVDLTQQLSTDILEHSSIIPITLQIGIEGSTHTESAVVNVVITYDNEEDPGLIDFSTVLYTAQYSVRDGKGELTFDQDIKVITDAADDNIKPTISDGSNYDKYFDITYADHTVLVKLVDDLPEDVLTSTSLIPLTLTLEITGTTHKSSAVLNIIIKEIVETKSVEFSDVLYHGKYQVTDGIGVLTLDEITVITEESDDNIEVIVSNEYNDYFNAHYASKVVTVDIKQQLPSDILNSSSFISVILQVAVKGATNKESAVLNIAIIYDNEEDPGLVDFSTVLYTGHYLINDGKGQLELDEDIKVITDAADDQIIPSISDESTYAKYFAATYTNKIISVKLVSDIPEDTLTDVSLIALKLIVEITGTTHRSSAVLNILINDNAETRSVKFSDLLYNGKYIVTDGNGVLTVDENINVDTSEADSNIQVSVSNEYDGYISASYSNKIVTVSLIKQLSTEILNSSSVVPVILQAAVSGTSQQASAVLNIIIYYDGDNDTGLIEFSSILFNANYSVIDGQGKLEPIDEIKLITDQPDADIEASLSTESEYRDYFGISYSGHVISITPKTNLPEDVLRKNSFISVTLIAGIKETTHRTSAVLNVRIDKNDDNSDTEGLSSNMKTVYISVISILSILLLALIAAAVAFYLLRIRKQNYANLEEEDGRVRYNKHSLNRSSSDIKPASSLDERRPTGFVFNPISEDSVDGTDSIGEPEKTRRKSVAFDDHVEKLQLEPSNEEDNVSEDEIKNKPEITRV